MMTPHDRVLAACAFQRPDRIPRFETFWEYPDSWLERFGPREDLTDVAIWCPDEGTFPTRARILKTDGPWTYEVDSWGRTIRRREGAYFSETLEVPLPEGVDPDPVQFDAPDLDERFFQGRRDLADAARALEDARRRHCVFGKTGGPFLRSTFVRGEQQFLTDLVNDPPLAKAIADKVADHLTAVGLDELRRWSLHETGIWIFDDMAFNEGPLFSPRTFEQVLLPAYRRMIRAYKDAGAKYVFFHSDGDIRPLLDMLVDAGVEGLNPLERRAHMNIAAIRRQYPRLVLTGGMCNSDTLLNGPVERIRAEAREILDLGREGGVVIGTHSISPEIPIEFFAAYVETCTTYGLNPPSVPPWTGG